MGTKKTSLSQITKLAGEKKRKAVQIAHLRTERRAFCEKLEQLNTIADPSEQAVELKATIHQALEQIDEELQNMTGNL